MNKGPHQFGCAETVCGRSMRKIGRAP